MSVHDVVCDCLFDELIEGTLATIGGRLVKDPEDPEEPFLTPDGYVVIRVRDREPAAYARELERRVQGLRIVTVVDRTPAGTQH